MAQVRFKPEVEKRSRVAFAFLGHKRQISIPGADIQHIGSTAVPGSLTKGDLDIQVRESQTKHVRADAVLAKHYTRNVEVEVLGVSRTV